MTGIKLALRSLTRRKGNSLIKILSLGAGLAVGLILITHVLFQRSYDTFYPDSDRLWVVIQNWQHTGQGEEGMNQRSYTPGGVAAALRNEIPGVEAATLSTAIIFDAPILTGQESRINGSILLADSCFFDVLPRPMIAGDAKAVLSRPFGAIVSESFAASMTGDPMGQILSPEDYPGLDITVGGVFEDYPKNSTYEYDIILSFETCTYIWNGWDPRNYWQGNDRYHTIFRTAPGVTVEDIDASLKEMRRIHLPDEELSKAGVEIEYTAQSFPDYYRNIPEVRNLLLILSLIAVALLAAAVLNYVLVVISEYASRAKEIALLKCHGAGSRSIRSIIMTETALHMLLSLILAAGLVILFREPFENILGIGIGSIFTVKSVAVLIVICAAILLIAAGIPSAIFSRVPLASVFRHSAIGTKRSWKRVLLLLQVTGAAFLFMLVAVVWRQYGIMVNDDPGYRYENVVYYNSVSADSLSLSTAINNLQALPQVEAVAGGSALLWGWFSGNNVSLPGEDRELFNIADLYYADENYLPLFGVDIVEGEGFGNHSIPGRDILVSRKFADMICELAGWNDGVTGKTVDISEHGAGITIRGVFENIRLGSMVNETTRPAALFYARGQYCPLIFARLTELSAGNIQLMQEALEKAMPGKEILIRTASTEIVEAYDSVRRFRDAIISGSIITLLIVFIGLTGYLKSETARRKKEIALRRVNGASIPDILRIFLSGILFISLPGVLIGGVLSYFAAVKYMENLSGPTTVPWWLLLCCAVIMLLVISAVVVMNCIRSANRNPAESLRSE